MLLSIIIPVYNEEATLEEILRKVGGTPYHKEIILIDDGSGDGTADILTAWEKTPTSAPIGDSSSLRIIRHKANMGKGAAVRTGLRAAAGDIILIQDADLEYDPDDYGSLLRPILTGKSSVVYGSRFLGEHKAMFYWHQVGNKLLTFMVNLLYNTTLTDMETCYKCFSREVADRLHLKSCRFDIEPEITAKILKMGYRIYEVPIAYNGREYEEGKKITWKDGISALRALLHYRFFD